MIPDVPLAAHVPGAPAGALVALPCYCYILTAGSQAVLVDTGANGPNAASAGLVIAGDTGELLERALRACGVAASDVTLVVHTHLHYDHVGNDLWFPNAEVVVQSSEVAWATGPECDRFYVEADALVRDLGDRLRQVEGRAEVRSGIRVLWNGGHTPGHQSVLVTRPSGEACICGDVVPLRQNTAVIGSSCPREDEMRAFLAAAGSAGWEMIPSHDPELRSHAAYVGSADPVDEEIP